MKVLLFTICVILLVGCSTPWRMDYLTKANNHANQDEILIRLGPPDRKDTLSDGRDIWLYRYGGSIVSIDPYTGSVYGDSCTQYILTFDTDKILRHWVQQNC
jgi:hypothetical protein